MYEKANIQFFDKLKIITQNVRFDGRSVTYCIRKREISSKGRYKDFKANKLFIAIGGEIQKNVLNIFVKVHIRMLWRRFFKKIANNGDYVYNICNRPLNSFDRPCREWYL